MICPKCKTTLDQGTTVCDSCGYIFWPAAEPFPLKEKEGTSFLEIKTFQHTPLFDRFIKLTSSYHNNFSKFEDDYSPAVCELIKKWSQNTYLEFSNFYSDRLVNQQPEALKAIEKAYFRTVEDGYLLFVTESELGGGRYVKLPNLKFENLRYKWIKQIQEHYIERAKSLSEVLRSAMLRSMQLNGLMMLLEQEDLERLAVDAGNRLEENLISNTMLGYLIGVVEEECRRE